MQLLDLPQQYLVIKVGYYAGPDGYITLPPGLDVTSVPMVMPQIGISFMGTEALFRYVPKIDVGGKDLSLFGLGS